MSIFSSVRFVTSISKRLEAVREARRRAALREIRRRRSFEALESREMLDAANAFEVLPDVITIADPNTYHYAIEGRDFQIIDQSAVEGLTASFPTGDQVAFTIMETTTDGAPSTLGDVVIQLFSAEGEAPTSSEHFKGLVQNGFYEGLKIHRIMEGFMFQGGSPFGNGIGGSGPDGTYNYVADEYSDVLTHSRRGTVAYANSNSDTATPPRYNTSDSQFYVTFGAPSFLDGRYNVFGYVVDGYDVIDYLEDVEVRNNGAGEVSSPVNTYTFTNVRVLGQTDPPTDQPTQGVLRVTADETANGVTTFSYSSKNAAGEEKFNQTTIYVGDKGLKGYVQDALDKVNFELTAGDDITVDLPTTFGDKTITYTVTANDDAARYELTPLNPTSSRFALLTEDASGQYMQLTIKAKLSSGEETTVEQDVFITPKAPTISFEGNVEDVAKQIGSTWFIGSDFEGPKVNLTVLAYEPTEQGTYGSTFLVAIEGADGVYENVLYTRSREYDEETGLSTYLLTLAPEDPLVDGDYVITVQQTIPVDQVTDHDPLLSEPATLAFTVDTHPLEIVDAPSSITLRVGEAGSMYFKTNKLDADGTNRDDVVFTLEALENVSKFLKFDENDNGRLVWTAPPAADSGSYNAAIRATDALGRSTLEIIDIVVGGAPVFDELETTTAKTGETFAATIVAKDSADETIPIVYKLVGEGYPASFNFDAPTGRVTWAIPSDYLPTSVEKQEFAFTIEATERIQKEDGTIEDGQSTQKTFIITVENDTYDDEASEAPVWGDIPAQTVLAGETLRFTATATVSSAAQGVKYELTGDHPEGMTIHAATGELVWKVPQDFVPGTRDHKKTIDVSLKATTIVSEVGSTVNYGDSSTKTVSITVTNPNYDDEAPIFSGLDTLAGSTGATYKTKISATDPNGEADKIKYELVPFEGEPYPNGFGFNTETQEISWAVPTDYLEENVTVRAFRFTMRATEQFLDEEGEYADRKSSEETFEIMIANGAYVADEVVKPTMSDVADQTVETGKKLEVAVSATLPQDLDHPEDYSIEYSLVEDSETAYPDGLEVNSETGALVWEVPSDYFGASDETTKTIDVKVQARVVVGDPTEMTTDYSGQAQKEFKITINKAKEEPQPTEYDSWQAWFVDWVAKEQKRYDGHAANLATYLSDYIAAVDKRDADLKKAAQDYKSGGIKTLDELIEKRAEILGIFELDTQNARENLVKNDAQTEKDYAADVVKMNEELEKLKEAGKSIPADSAKQTEKAYDGVKKAGEKATDNTTNVRLRNPVNGARVATNLSDVLKVWRNGYSRSSRFAAVFADPDAVADVTTPTESDNSQAGTNTPSGSESQTGTNAPSGSESQTGTNTQTGDDDEQVVEVVTDENGNVIQTNPVSNAVLDLDDEEERGITLV